MTPLSTRMSAPRVPVFAPVAKRPQMLKLVPILQAPVGCMVAEGAKSGEAVSMHPGVPDSHLSVHLFNMSIGLEVAVPSMPPTCDYRRRLVVDMFRNSRSTQVPCPCPEPACRLASLENSTYTAWAARSTYSRSAHAVPCSKSVKKQQLQSLIIRDM